jgi:hypothetical protein
MLWLQDYVAMNEITIWLCVVWQNEKEYITYSNSFALLHAHVAIYTYNNLSVAMKCWGMYVPDHIEQILTDFQNSLFNINQWDTEG